MNLKEYMKRDGWVLIICLAAVLVCLAVYNNSLGVLSSCNDYWQQRWQEAKESYIGFADAPANYNIGFNFSIENNKEVTK